MFLTTSDFLDTPLKVPNQEESVWFSNWMEAKEEETLKSLLGVSLYTDFIEGLEDSSIEQKWIDLRDGTTYVFNDVTYEYAGLVDLLKPRIMALWYPYIHRKTTSVGVVINQGQQNTTTTAPDLEYIENQNAYVRKVGGQIYCASCIAYHGNSFYGFMKANEIDYEGWIFEQPKIENYLGL
jgi:hypothetical protein